MQYYFSYGSNTLQAQMQERCPDSTFFCVAVLRDYKLHFPRYSQHRNGGVASIQQCEGSHVWGVVYKLSSEDELKLDIYEGVPRSYLKENINVEIAQSKSQLEAYTYIANIEEGTFYPSKTYLNIIISGLSSHPEVPKEYIHQLSEYLTNEPFA